MPIFYCFLTAKLQKKGNPQIFFRKMSGNPQIFHYDCKNKRIY